MVTWRDHLYIQVEAENKDFDFEEEGGAGLVTPQRRYEFQSIFKILLFFFASKVGINKMIACIKHQIIYFFCLLFWVAGFRLENNADSYHRYFLCL